MTSGGNTSANGSDTITFSGDGTPTASASNVPYAGYSYYGGTIVVKLFKGLQEVRVLTRDFTGSGTVTATLSDGSATPVVCKYVPAAGSWTTSYFISADSDNATLTVAHLSATQGGEIFVHTATLLLPYDADPEWILDPEQATLWIQSTTSDVTAALTGSSATASAGTLVGTRQVAITGNGTTANVGNVTASPSVALSGNAATSAAGTLSPGSVVALTGLAATSSAGTAKASPSQAITGNASTSSIGSVSPSTQVGLTGLAATGSPGTVTTGSDVTAALTGIAATSAAGTVGVAVTVPLTGSAESAAAGSVVFSPYAALTGSAATGSAGAVASSSAISLTGQGATASAGSVTVAGDVTVALTGVVATAQAGNVSVPSAGNAFSGGWADIKPVDRKARAERIKRQRIELGILEEEKEPQPVAAQKAQSSENAQAVQRLEQLTALIEAYERQIDDAIQREISAKKRAALKEKQRRAQEEADALEQSIEEQDIAYVARILATL